MASPSTWLGHGFDLQKRQKQVDLDRDRNGPAVSAAVILTTRRPHF
jgi:hypothetical protein